MTPTATRAELAQMMTWAEDAFFVAALGAAAGFRDAAPLQATIAGFAADIIARHTPTETGSSARFASMAAKLMGGAREVARGALARPKVLLGAGALWVAHDWLTEDEQIRRAAIDGHVETVRAGLVGLDPTQRERALRQVIGGGGLASIASGGPGGTKLVALGLGLAAILGGVWLWRRYE